MKQLAIRPQKEKGKAQFMGKFSKKELWKYIECVIWEVIYKKKGFILWGKLKNRTMGISQVKFKEMFVGRHVYKR